MISQQTFVVDTSVFVKCLANENQTGDAEALVALANESRIRLVAPHFMQMEVLNVVAREVHRGKFTKDQARRAGAILQSSLIESIPDETLVAQAFELSLAHQQAVYDCLYLSLALQLGCPLVTADQRFFTGVHRAFPMVYALGSRIPGLSISV